MSDPDGGVVPFREQGCAWCRERWISRSDQPELVGISLEYQCHLYRCGVCSAWWEYGLNHPHEIDDALALRIAATVEPQP
ncbi:MULTISPECIES: hypothetical protein [unclassified Curtobacterium]|uniref:hypothetical protein n=1 Tax=unclassified Curtobacterium TaxID=257496 RepID=UPI003820062F